MKEQVTNPIPEEITSPETPLAPKPCFTHRIGGITYRVNVRFSEKSTEGIEDKIKRLVLAECEGVQEGGG